MNKKRFSTKKIDNKNKLFSWINKAEWINKWEAQKDSQDFKLCWVLA